MDKFNKDDYDPYEDFGKLISIGNKDLSSEMLDNLEKFIKDNHSSYVNQFNNIPSNLATCMDKSYLKGKVEAYREIYAYLFI